MPLRPTASRTLPSRSYSLLVLSLKKGEGKKKPKQSGDEAAAEPEAQAPARRILPGSVPGFSFKQVQRYVKIRNARAENYGVEIEYRAPQRTLQLPKASHVVSQEEHEQAKRERELAVERKRQAEIDADLEKKRIRSRRVVVLLDGYNFLHAFQPTKKLIGEERFSEARQHGVNEVKDYAGYIDQKVVIVFDSNRAGGDREPTRREEDGKWVETVFASEEGSADAFIEAEVRRLGAETPPPRIVVVTNDNDLRTTASVSEIKPILISVDHFLERMKKADENMKEAIKMTGDGKTRVVTAQKQFNRMGNHSRGANLLDLRAQLVTAQAAARCKGDTCTVDEEAEEDPEGGGTLGPRAPGARQRRPVA